jgi:phosphomannomutase
MAKELVMNPYDSFKAYDIRGELETQLTPDFAERVGRAFTQYLGAKSVVVGGDIRLSTPELKAAFARGCQTLGAEVIDIGLCGTEEVYFATSALGVDGGCMVTASHNPINYNGMKLVRKDSRPISGATGLQDIRALAEAGVGAEAHQGTVKSLDHSAPYIEHLMSYVDPGKLPAGTLLLNAGNGAAGPTVDRLEAAFQRAGSALRFEKMFNTPDGTFPNGIPNPLLHDQQPVTGQAVREAGADFGVAFDGDFDRCFFWDHEGTFIEGYYVVGMLAEAFLQQNPGARIVYDPRLTWNTEELVASLGGEALPSQSGHAFIKETMRQKDAIYGGEMSAHHYFKSFAYCDSGMIPWLTVLDLLMRKQTTLAALVKERMARYPSPGEINSSVSDADETMARVRARYAPEAIAESTLDGLSLEFDTWRFNLRKSNTEPVIRLNLETRGDGALMQEKTDELLALIRR